jgi:hypothetical protein
VKNRQQLSFVFARFIWPKSQIEIYGEYGRNYYTWNSDEYTDVPLYSNAYMFGLRKLFPLRLSKYKDAYINVNVEFTQLEVSPSTAYSVGNSWCKHRNVVHGYTHKGQNLGAGIGSGSNLQSLKISWVRNLKSIGVQFDRYLHNNDFWFQAVKDMRANWVDISATAFVNWDYKIYCLVLR